MPVEIFLCYAHEDSTYVRKLKKHLTPLQRENLISVWHDVNISPGAEWEREINTHLNTAGIILLLISPDFMASDYCFSVEMQRAMERHERGEARVIPIFLRPTDWKGAPFGKLHALPTDAKPITDPSWVTQDKALSTVVEKVRKVIEDLFIHSPVIPFVPSKTAPEWERETPVLQSRSSPHEVQGNWLTYCRYCGASIRFRAESRQGTVSCPGCRRSQQYQIGPDWGRGDFEIKVEGSDAREVQEVSLALIEEQNCSLSRLRLPFIYVIAQHVKRRRR